MKRYLSVNVSKGYMTDGDGNEMAKPAGLTDIEFVELIVENYTREGWTEDEAAEVKGEEYLLIFYRED